MALIHWGRESDLLSQMNRMQQELDSMFSAFYPRRGLGRRPAYRTRVYPSLNIYDDGETYVVRAEVPGVDPKSLDIEATGDTLTIRGERELPDLPEGASYHRRERDFGAFSRSFTLPDKIDSNKVVAACEDGILEIRLPHAEEAKARKIAVKAS